MILVNSFTCRCQQVFPFNYYNNEDYGLFTKIIQGVAEDIPFLGGALEKILDRSREQDAESILPFANEKLFGQNSAMNSFYVSLRQSCNNDAACIQRGADAVAGDPRGKELLAGHPEISDRAKIKELIAARTRQAEAQGQLIQHFDNMEALTAAFATLTTTQLTILQATQTALINNTAEIINTRQKHTTALTRIQSTINANQAELKKRSTKDLAPSSACK
jgi:hypothetical protein